MSTDARFGFRCDSKRGERRLTEAAAAFLAHCHADPRTEPDRERYLSAFAYPAEFKTHLDATGSTKDYRGRCWSWWLWFDLDRDDPALALTDTRRLVGYVLYLVFSTFADDDLLYFFSGRRGYHVGVPLPHAPPADTFHLTCRELAEGIAAEVGVTIDSSIYDKVRLLRAPNSTHPKTGLHKIRLTHDELMGLSADRITELAAAPVPFDLPTVTAVPQLLAERWQAAEMAVREKLGAQANRAATTAGRLNRATLDFIKHGTEAGKSRHICLFSAAANLREFGAPEPLVTALLEEQGLDDGLPPKEVERQIRTGIAHADRQAEGGDA